MEEVKNLIVLLTEDRYEKINTEDIYQKNIGDDDSALASALEHKGYSVRRVSWENPSFDWSNAIAVIIRTPWNYFHRFEDFKKWMKKVTKITRLINPPEILYWNLNKKYLFELNENGVRIPNSIFVPKQGIVNLHQTAINKGWSELVIKPAVSGAARETYYLKNKDLKPWQNRFQELVNQEDFIIQEFQKNVLSRGEISLVLFGGKYSHAVLKKAKTGDFRVQDDFGGSVEKYAPNQEEITFAEQTLTACPFNPLYARVDLIWNNEGELALAELEIIEPELWFRMFPKSAALFADSVHRFLNE